MKSWFFSLILTLLGLAFALPAHAQDPHGEMRAESPAPVDRIEPAPDLPRGTIEALILDANEQPIPQREVRLGILFQKIAEGESRSSRDGVTGPNGVVRFDGLDSSSSFSYRIATKLAPAEYASQPFNLRENGGMRVVVHVFPATADPSKTMVGMRGFFYIETRDDVFQVEVLFRVINLGKVAWVPEQAFMDLPAGFKAFSAGQAMSDVKFEAVEGRGARLVGTFPPGSRDASFRFQVPKPAEHSVTFRASTPPRTVEMRVIAVAGKNMGMSVEGFDAPQEGNGPTGDRVLVTRKLVSRTSPEVGPFVVTLTGLPVPGNGRWVAAGIAFALALCGGAAAGGKLRLVSSERSEGDRARARELLLAELVNLEHAKQRSEIGPNAYERTRRHFADALTRIGLPTDTKRPKRALRERQA
ncbi:MAG TPA: hypothetical protein VGK73_40135 [Polyangiaceae bacterium]